MKPTHSIKAGGLLVLKVLGSIVAGLVLMCLLITFMILLPFLKPPKEKTDIKDYSYMYNMIDDWNRTVSPDSRRDSILGFGAYLYNSHLVLFPRESPDTLQEFYYCWDQGMDVDEYAIYFTCTLTEEDYEGFVAGLENFTITAHVPVETEADTQAGTATATVVETVYTPLRDTEHFPYPAYILQ